MREMCEIISKATEDFEICLGDIVKIKPLLPKLRVFDRVYYTVSDGRGGSLQYMVW